LIGVGDDVFVRIFPSDPSKILLTVNTFECFSLYVFWCLL